MADTLPVLIKLAERKVEEAQAALARTREALESVKFSITECEREAREAFLHAVGENDLRMLQAAGAFQERKRLEKVRLEEVLRLMEVEEERLRGELQKVFAEQKRYELLLERQKMAAAKKHAKKVQDQLDDIAQRRLDI